MKARRVKGVDPRGSMADGLEQVVRVRVDELFALAATAQDPAEVRAAHDLRIAAKRLRYALQIAAEPCFGRYAATAIKRCRALQEVLGELHDCDVALPRVCELQDDLGTTGAPEWRGLEALRVHLQARRGLLFERFLSIWGELERDGFGARLAYALQERPAITSPSRDAHASARESAA
jgi:CHAD domain-containing protein